MNTNFQRSIETTLAVSVLEGLQVGEVASYGQLAEAIGKNPQTDGYTYVRQARRIVERDLQCVFAVIPNEGVKRLEPREVINHGASDLGHVRRHTKRSMSKQITLVPVEKNGKLTNEERIQFHQQLSHLGVIAHALTPRATRKLREAVVEANKRLPVGDVIRLFTPSTNGG